MAIDILTHADGIRHSGFEGEPEETARGLLVLVACALQYMYTQRTDPNADSSTIEELTNSFLFGEIQKRTMQTKFSSVICETANDKDALLSLGGLILPLGGMTLFLTFPPTEDDTIRTSLPKEIRLALRSHKALFYNGGLLFSVASYVAPNRSLLLPRDHVKSPMPSPTSLRRATPLGCAGYSPRRRKTPTRAHAHYRGLRPH